MSANQELFELKFYKWEKEFKDKPYLRQPIGETWEEYTCLLYTSDAADD